MCALVYLCVLVLLSDGGLRSKTTCQLQVPPGYYQGCFSDRSGHPTESTAWTIVVEYHCTDHGTGYALCNVHEVCARQAKAIIVSDNVQFSVDSAFVENI